MSSVVKCESECCKSTQQREKKLTEDTACGFWSVRFHKSKRLSCSLSTNRSLHQTTAELVR